MQNYFKSGVWNVICSKCNKEQSIDNFYLHSNGKPRKQCKTCVLENNKKNESPEKRNRYANTYRERNYQTCLDRNKTWRKENLQYDAFRAATYRARKLNQTPKWADLDLIKDFYLNCPEGHHVDHIVPLKGINVSGFHIETNLQYLTAHENLKKRNQYAELL